MRRLPPVRRYIFRKLTSDEIEDYLKTDEPWDKAGGYGIQGLAGKFVDKIDGSYHNVVRLPISQLAERLPALKIFFNTYRGLL